MSSQMPSDLSPNHDSNPTVLHSALGSGSSDTKGSGLTVDQRLAAESAGTSGTLGASSSAGHSAQKPLGGGSRFTPSAVQESAKGQVGSYVATVKQAAASGAWIYPIYGVVYMASHPRLIGPLFPLILRALAISAAVVIACFFFLYLPQVAWLALFSGPLAFIAAVPLVLGEAYVILMFLGKKFLMGTVGTDLFDAVLVQKGHADLVEKARPVSKGKNATLQLGKVLSKPLSKLSTDNIVRYIITMPLNLIPVVGTVFFLTYNGYKSGPSYMGRYFQLKGWDKERRAAFVSRRRGAYAAFGTVAMVFNLIPIVSVILGLAAQVGAALWACDMENRADRAAGKAPAQEVEVSLPTQGTQGTSDSGKKLE